MIIIIPVLSLLFLSSSCFAGVKVGDVEIIPLGEFYELANTGTYRITPERSSPQIYGDACLTQTGGKLKALGIHEKRIIALYKPLSPPTEVHQCREGEVIYVDEQEFAVMTEKYTEEEKLRKRQREEADKQEAEEARILEEILKKNGTLSLKEVLEESDW